MHAVLEPLATQAASTFLLPRTSTEYSNSRLEPLPGVTIEARCTTLSMACAASVCDSAGSRTSCTR